MHSSPGNSFNKYQAAVLPRSASGSLSLVSSPPGSILQAVSSPTGTAQRSFCSAVKDVAVASPRSGQTLSEFNNDDDEESPSSMDTTGPSSLEQQQQHHEYENVDNQQQQHARLAVEARSKLLMSAAAAAAPRSRERRNSFRQAMDQFGRPYEQIWFKEEEEMDGGVAGTRGPEGDLQQQLNAVTATTEPSSNAHQLPRNNNNNNVNIDTRQLADGGRPSVSAAESFLAAGRTDQQRVLAPLRQAADGPVYANASRIDVSKYPAYTPSAVEERVRRPEQIGGGGGSGGSGSGQASRKLSNIR